MRMFLQHWPIQFSDFTYLGQMLWDGDSSWREAIEVGTGMEGGSEGVGREGQGGS